MTEPLEPRYLQNSFKYYLDQKVEIFSNGVIADTVDISSKTKTWPISNTEC